MQTECSASSVDGRLSFSKLGQRRVEADFSAGPISSDGGALLLREADLRVRLTERLARCFVDHRHPDRIEHSVQQLLAQRIYGLALGYEDLNDHEQLSRDPLLGAAAGKADPAGQRRRRERDRGQGLASPSTLGRIDRTLADASSASRYAKIVCDFDALGDEFVKLFIERFEQPPERLFLDVDPTDIALHGHQEQRFYHGYYRHHCYLPMYLFCGPYPLAMKLRPSNIDACLGVVELLTPVIERLRQVWPAVHLVVRADSGFCRDELMSFCEQHGVDYVLGLARNKRLTPALDKQMEQARREHLKSGQPTRRFRDFRYQTRTTWSRKRRVVGKAEYTAKGANPRFVVTSLPARHFEKRYLYEELYCARGEMENRIKEQLSLFGERASCHTFRGNEQRLWWAMAAHLLIVVLRETGLNKTAMASAQATTIRTRLLKIGALVKVSVRRLYIRMSTAFPLQALFAQVLRQLQGPKPAT